MRMPTENEIDDLKIIELDRRREKARVTLPELVIDGADPTAAAKQLAVFIAAKDRFLSNGYAPAQVVVDDNDMPRAVEVTVEAVRVHAHEVCRPIKLREGAYKPVALSSDIARLYLSGLEGNWGLAPFRGITTGPILQADGTIRIARGYDRQSGLWCHNVPELTIPEKPQESDTAAALLRIRNFFRTFPFADSIRINDETLGVEVNDTTQPPGLHESVFLAGLFTAVTRQSIKLAPGFLCNAPHGSGAGTGKGLLIRSMAMLASGVAPAAFTSGHESRRV